MPFLKINDRTLHYADIGPSEDSNIAVPTTLLMIHGLGSSQNFYFPILSWLKDFRCIIPDTSGAGRSPFPGGGLTIFDIANHAHALMSKLGIQKAIIVGHSMGGTVASDFASRYPERTSAVVAIGPVNPNLDAARIFETRVQIVAKGSLLCFIQGPNVQTRLTGWYEDGMEPIADSIPKAATGSESTALHHAFIRELILAQDPAGYIAHCKVIINAKKPDYAAVKAPFLIIAGQEDKSAPLDGCVSILNSISSSQKILELLEGVGHWHCVEASNEVGRVMSEFCASIE
jgi:pimeloyl-ACP methyl ester carboxylesterase